MKRWYQVLGVLGGMLACGAAAVGLWMAREPDAQVFPEAARRRAQQAYAFEAPARTWSEGLPIGNGRLAALWVGEPTEEHFYLNEESVWAPPREQPINAQGAALLAEIRRLLFAGEEAAASQLCEETFLRGRAAISAYLPLATLTVRQALGPVRDYRRGIRLDEGTAYTTFTEGANTQRRQAFVAYDDDVIIVTYQAAQPGTLNLSFALSHPGALGASTPRGPNQLHLKGSTGSGGVAFDVLADISADCQAQIESEGERIQVRGATCVTVAIAAYTDFNRAAPNQPLPDTRLAQCLDRVQHAQAHGAQALHRNHARAFQARYCQAYVTLGERPPCRSLTVRLPEARKAEHIAPDFLLLNYDFYRYLLISSSRPGGLPMTLQGKWNPLMEPPWESDWHLDINLSMAYWPAGAWGLADLAEPLTSLAELTLPQSRAVAREMLGAEGCFLGTCTDLWGACAPFRYACWGMTFSGGAWLLQDALEPLRYTRDAALARRLLPLLREQCRFYLSWLVRSPQHNLWVSGPCVSPENTYLTPNGVPVAIDMGPAYEQELIAATFHSYLSLSEGYGSEVDEPLREAVCQRLAALARPQVGPDGALMEWSRPYAEAEPAHRHLSFAYALMPGHNASLQMPASFAEAVSKRLDLREAAGHHLMGWSLGHMACLRARLNQGDKAMAALDHAPKYLTPNLFTTASGQPQVSDLGGVPAALNEMLLRHETETIEVLPALPARLSQQGSFRLMTTRGLWVTCAWQAGRVTHLELKATQAGSYTLRYPGGETNLFLDAGQTRTLIPHP
ncbi:MAG: glycosyl hydrolase family 95 catalytic domain-containing protein [Candidatus Spyradenecus sp.]